MNRREENFDVVIAGGGSAGLAAGVAAARAGAKTLLLERSGMLGGMGSLALVHTICGLYHLRNEPGAVYANAGFAREFAEALRKTGGAGDPVRLGRVDVLYHHPAAMAHCADRLTSAEPNLEVRFHTELTGVEIDRGTRRLTRLEAICRGVPMHIKPGTVVDCTGDAVVGFLADANFQQTDSAHLQRPAYIFALSQVAPGALDGDARLRLARLVLDGTREGRLPAGAQGAALREGLHPGQVYCTVDLPAEGFDPFDPGCLSDLERVGREIAWALCGFLRDRVPGFAGSHLAALPARIGVRESRRLTCLYQLTENDILTGAEFADSVGLITWPMEMREKATGPKLRFPLEDKPCQIPLRALQSADFSNLFCAGRCIGSTHEAQAALRVIGACLTTGEAAGHAAAQLTT